MSIPSPSHPIEGGARIFTICNACRYCEGYCAVFPAMERRLDFNAADLNYLANLCHNCGECYYACQYAPPHEFAVNVPKTLATIRSASYQQYAWPRGVGGWLAPAAFVAALAIWDALAFGRAVPKRPADFYAVIPHDAMAGIFGALALILAGLMAAGWRRFWQESGENLSGLWNGPALLRAAHDAFALEDLGGAGHGCTYPDENRSRARWWFHHLTFYGFLLCFASTTVAAIYHYGSGWSAPYPYLSLPVALGTAGGIGLLIGPAGLWWLKQKQDQALRAPGQHALDLPFLVILVLTSGTGLALLAFRGSGYMRWLLILHLAVVFAFFVTLPYGKFVHGVYRAGALLRYALERSREERPS